MTRYSPLQIENMSVDGRKKTKLSEPVGGRGDGTLLFKRQGQDVEAYYRYRSKGSDTTIAIGRYSRTGKSGFSLPEIRDKARDLARLKKDIAPADLKDHLELQKRKRLRQQQADKKQAEIEAAHGTFADLCKSYVNNLYRREAPSAKDVERSIKTNLLKPFPDIASKKANTVTADDLMIVFRAMLERGVTTTYNRFRSTIMAAFNFGMQADYDPRAQMDQAKRFCIQFNPVPAIKKYAEYERVRDRRLTNDELQKLWHHVEKGEPTWSPLYGLLVRFVIACFGNRPKQLSQISWEDIDFRYKTLRFVDSKGKNGIPKKRIIPMTNRAIWVLQEASKISGRFEGPFMVTGKSFIDVSNLSDFILTYNRCLAEEAEVRGERPPEFFTAKDIRRTATRLLTDCRVPQEQRFLLQSRKDGSVESRHYDHDDRLPEKRHYAKIYDEYLQKIIDGAADSDKEDNVVDFNLYRTKLS